MNFSFFKTAKETLTTPKDNKEEFFNFFQSSELHTWIFEDKTIARNIMYFLDNLPNEVFNYFDETSPLAFLYSSGSYSCAIPALEMHHVVLIFPETLQMLKAADPSTAFAILAHELGHLCLKHVDRHMSSIEKQFEADEFSAQIGYKKELIEFLEGQEDMHLEIKMRLKELYTNKALVDQ